MKGAPSMLHAAAAVVVLLGAANLYLHGRISGLQERVAQLEAEGGPEFQPGQIAQRMNKISEMDAALLKALDNSPVWKGNPGEPAGSSLGSMRESAPGTERSDDRYNVRIPSRMTAVSDDKPGGAYKTTELSLRCGPARLKQRCEPDMCCSVSGCGTWS